MQTNPALSSPVSPVHPSTAWLENPWHQKGGFSESWMHLCLILAAIMLTNSALSFFFEGTIDIYFTCFGIYLWMVAGILLVIYTLKKDEITLHKSACLYPQNTWIENAEGAEVLSFTFSLGTPYRKDASYAAEIPIRTIRHLYLHPNQRMIYVDGDVLSTRTDTKKPPKSSRIWRGAWVCTTDDQYTYLLYELHRISHLVYEPVIQNNTQV